MTKQNMPRPSLISKPIEGEFIRHFEATRESQYQKGIKEYGIPLMTFNGRDAHLDAIQEYVDLGRYIAQMQMEREYLEELLREAKDALLTGSPSERFAMRQKIDKVVGSREN